MSEETAQYNTRPGQEQDIPDAVDYAKRPRSSQLIWLIPLIALLIGLFLAVRFYLEKGPVVTISFKSGEGIEAGKTKIRYKNVQIGLVRSVTIAKENSSVLVTADISRDAARFLKADTSFWVVRARITGSSITGLGTLTGGSYIGMDVGSSQENRLEFTGLDTPPVVTMDVPGRQFTLHAADLGSLTVGSPLFYRHLQVGEVVAVNLDQNGETILLQVFVREPYDKYVRKNSVFWHASGIDFRMDAGGMTVNTESLLSIVMGGIAFQARENFDEAAQAEQGHHFTLFSSKDVALKEPDSLVENYQLVFNESVRGLTVGAPVELRGIVVGEVTSIKAVLDGAGKKIRMAVKIRFYPDRLKYIPENKSLPNGADDHRKLLDRLVAHGFRAQLQSGSLLTGQLFVALDFFPNSAPASITWQGNPPELPTISGNMAQLQSTLMKMVQKLEKLPLEDLGTDLHHSLNSLDAALTSANSLMQNLDANLVPEARLMLQDVRKILDRADNTLQEVRLTMNESSPLQTDLRETLRELGRAAQSLRLLGDYLEQNPEALLRGKRGD